MSESKSEAVKEAITRAIRKAGDVSLTAAAEQLAAGGAITGINGESDFPPSHPFARSTW